MAVVLSDIYVAFPELDLSQDATPNTAQDALVTEKLALAIAMTDRAIYPNTEQANQVTKYLCARLVALSPAGMHLKLAAKDGSTIYDPIYYLLIRPAASGYRVP
jgi:hypothetical protein